MYIYICKEFKSGYSENMYSSLSDQNYECMFRHARHFLRLHHSMVYSHSSYLNFIVLEENIGFEVVDGLFDNICVFG